MSLNWSVENIKDYENVCFERRAPRPSEPTPDAEHLDENGHARYLRGITDGLIWSSMFIDCCGISEENVSTFCARLSIYQDIFGPLMVGPDGPERITDEDVIAHIGLTTNVSQKSDKEFLSNIVKTELERRAFAAQKKVVSGVPA